MKLQSCFPLPTRDIPQEDTQTLHCQNVGTPQYGLCNILRPTTHEQRNFKAGYQNIPLYALSGDEIRWFSQIRLTFFLSTISTYYGTHFLCLETSNNFGVTPTDVLA